MSGVYHAYFDNFNSAHHFCFFFHSIFFLSVYLCAYTATKEDLIKIKQKLTCILLCHTIVVVVYTSHRLPILLFDFRKEVSRTKNTELPRRVFFLIKKRNNFLERKAKQIIFAHFCCLGRAMQKLRIFFKQNSV